jgi:hypothetical protein
MRATAAPLLLRLQEQGQEQGLLRQRPVWHLVLLVLLHVLSETRSSLRARTLLASWMMAS